MVCFMIYRICHCMTTYTHAVRKEGRCLRDAPTKECTHTRAPVHHQAEIADASSDLKYVLKRCDPFLHVKSVCPQKRPPLRTHMQTCVHVHGCVSQKWARSGCSRTKEQKEGVGEPGSDSMRQKDGAHSYKFVSQQSGSCAHGHDHISF